MTASPKVLLMVKMTLSGDIHAFNVFWDKYSLPHWIKRGATHIGSYVYVVGGPSNVIVRLMEWPDYETWIAWDNWLYRTQEGLDLLKQIREFGIISAEHSFLIPAPTK
jgi:hypothetical protein